MWTFFFFWPKCPKNFYLFFFFSFCSIIYGRYVHIYWHGKMFTTYCWMTKSRFIYSFYFSIIFLFDNDDYFKMDIWIFRAVLGLDLYLLCFYIFLGMYVLSAVCFSYFLSFPSCFLLVFPCGAWLVSVRSSLTSDRRVVLPPLAVCVTSVWAGGPGGV